MVKFVAKTARNHLNEEITPLLPTGIGHRFSQTISNLGHAALLRRCELPPRNESAELTQGALYTVKKVREFPVPSRDVTTKLSLGGNNDVITELFLPRGSLVSDILAVDGKLVNLFLRCSYHTNSLL
jgi:hypothetical protein